MNERQFATWLAGRLDAGARSLDGEVLEALDQARRRALRGGSPARGTNALTHVWLGRPALFGAGLVAAGVAVFALLSLFNPLGAGQEGGAVGADLDILLLTDDLPPNAYLDEDFPAWPRLPGLCRS